jgi:hypothetical protein
MCVDDLFLGTGIIIKVRQQPCLQNVKARENAPVSHAVNFAHCSESGSEREKKKEKVPLVQNSAAILLWDESFWRFASCRWQVSTYLRPHCEGRVTNM